MKPYALRVKKNRFLLELSSENPELIATEFAKVAKDFFAIKVQTNLYTEESLALKPLPEALKKNFKAKLKPIKVEEDLKESNVEEKIVETKELPKVLPAALKKGLKNKIKPAVVVEDLKEELTVDSNVEEKIVETKELPKVLPAALKKGLKNKIKPAVIEENSDNKVIEADFAKMLAQKSKEKSNVVEKKTSELKKTYAQMQQLISEKTLKNNVDYVVAAAYYLSQFEGVLRFTEENIKSKVLPFLEEEFDHNDVLDAIDRRFLRVIPDFTGVSDTIEFELTEYGEEYFINEL